MQFLGNLEATQFIANIITAVFSKCILLRCLLQISKRQNSSWQGIAVCKYHYTQLSVTYLQLYNCNRRLWFK